MAYWPDLGSIPRPFVVFRPRFFAAFFDTLHSIEVGSLEVGLAKSRSARPGRPGRHNQVWPASLEVGLDKGRSHGRSPTGPGKTFLTFDRLVLDLFATAEPSQASVWPRNAILTSFHKNAPRAILNTSIFEEYIYIYICVYICIYIYYLDFSLVPIRT